MSRGDPLAPRPVRESQSEMVEIVLPNDANPLNALLGDPKKVFEDSHARVWEAIRALVKRAIKSGDMRKDIDPIDLLRALIGVANVATSPDWQQSARRLVDILITGSRPNK